MTRRLSVTMLATSTLLVVLAGCGSSAPPAGHALAAQACQSGGATAASLASQAAAANSLYATLSADEHANAATEAGEEAEQSDGSGDDSGLGSLSNAENLGSTGSIKVISDCAKLGLPVTPH